MRAHEPRGVRHRVARLEALRSDQGRGGHLGLETGRVRAVGVPRCLLRDMLCLVPAALIVATVFRLPMLVFNLMGKLRTPRTSEQRIDVHEASLEFAVKGKVQLHIARATKPAGLTLDSNTHCMLFVLGERFWSVDRGRGVWLELGLWMLPTEGILIALRLTVGDLVRCAEREDGVYPLVRGEHFGLSDLDVTAVRGETLEGIVDAFWVIVSMVFAQWLTDMAHGVVFCALLCVPWRWAQCVCYLMRA